MSKQSPAALTDALHEQALHRALMTRVCPPPRQRQAIARLPEPPRKVSRQRRFQLVRKAAGLCQRCGVNPSNGKTQCDECAARVSTTGHRRPLPSQWEAVDWTQHDTTIAAELGVTRPAVIAQRQARQAALAFLLVHPDKLTPTRPNN